MAIICKDLTGLSYSEIDADSGRITGVIVKDNNGNPIHIMSSVYLPFHPGDANQMELFIETIDVLQSVIDKYGHLAPLKIMGDFNAQIPRHVTHDR